MTDNTQIAGPARTQGTTLPNGGVATPRQVLPMPLGARNDMPVRAMGAILASPTQHLQQYFDVPMTLVFEVGRKDITVGELMELNQGSFIDLWHVSVDIIDIRINDRIVAYGEAIALKQRYGIRFGELETLLGLEDGIDG